MLCLRDVAGQPSGSPAFGDCKEAFFQFGIETQGRAIVSAQFVYWIDTGLSLAA